MILGYVPKQPSQIKKATHLYGATRQSPASVAQDNIIFLENSPSNQADNYFSYENEGYYFTSQSRIDNITELLELINVPKTDNIDDGELLFTLFTRYGNKYVEKIEGKFLVAIYNKEQKKLTLIQDTMEYSAFYYVESANGLYFSSSLVSLLDRFELDVELNWNIFYAIEECVVPAEGTTSYKNVFVLGSGHYLDYINGRAFRQKYWHPEWIKENRDITETEAITEARHLFQSAVRNRLNGSQSPSSMLSGGLDSGSVVVVAASLLESEKRNLTTYSHVPMFDINDSYVPRNKNGDETKLINTTIKNHANVKPHFLKSEELSILDGIKLYHLHHREPIFAATNAFWLHDIYKSASDNNHDVILTGEMGNGTISFTGNCHSMDWRHLNLKSNLKNVLRQIYYYGQKKLPQYLQYSKSKSKYVWQQHSYLDVKFRSSIQLESRLDVPEFTLGSKSRSTLTSQALMLAWIKPGYNTRLRSGYEVSEQYGICLRDPTADKRLVEFLLSLPNHLFVNKKGEPKQFIKKLMRGKLPDAVLFQQKKGLQSADNFMRARKDIPELKSIVKRYEAKRIDEYAPHFDRQRLLFDIERLSRMELNSTQTHHLLKSIGQIEFINNFYK